MEETRALKLVQYFPLWLISLDKFLVYEKSGFGPPGSQGTLVSQNRETAGEQYVLTLGSKYMRKSSTIIAFPFI